MFNFKAFHFHLTHWAFQPISHSTGAKVAGSAFATAEEWEGVGLLCSGSAAESTAAFLSARLLSGGV